MFWLGISDKNKLQIFLSGIFAKILLFIIIIIHLLRFIEQTRFYSLNIYLKIVLLKWAFVGTGVFLFYALLKTFLLF